MRSNWLGVAVVIVAAAVWAQLVLIPLASAPWNGAAGVLGALAGGFCLAVPVAGVALARARPALGVAAVLAGGPIALAAFGALAGQRGLARFDAPARVIAAATALGFVIAAVAWADSLSVPCDATVRPLKGPAGDRQAPPLRRSAPAVVFFAAAVLAVVAPALVAGRPPVTRAERLAGEDLSRGREALTAAGGLAIGTWLVLSAGARLVRGRSAPRRRITRGMAYLVWAVAVGGLTVMLQHVR